MAISLGIYPIFRQTHMARFYFKKKSGLLCFRRAHSELLHESSLFCQALKHLDVKASQCFCLNPGFFCNDNRCDAHNLWLGALQKLRRRQCEELGQIQPKPSRPGQGTLRAKLNQENVQLRMWKIHPTVWHCDLYLKIKKRFISELWGCHLWLRPPHFARTAWSQLDPKGTSHW